MGTSPDYPDRSGINRFGEDHIRPDYYEDEQGMRHPLVKGLEKHVAWSRDTRSEASHEKRHQGKGPRNFSRSDDYLREEVCEAFLLNPDLDPEQIDVSVQDGVVTLSGHVRIREDRYLAEDIAHNISGVKDVVNLISRGKWDTGDDPGGLIKGLR
jgi:osmotically-inducible protein OsmY